ncbi:hypothetical protein Scep_028730 [Stephania cephalantha]|uniref:Pectinesterase n=1 Tax=Stephania cephalantha TaxID=152367 RepID=A0AAP0EHS7_9MAGN
MPSHTPLLGGHSSSPNKSNTCSSCSALSIALSLIAITISSTALLSINNHFTNSSSNSSSLSRLCERAHHPPSCQTLLHQELQHSSVLHPSNDLGLLNHFLASSVSRISDTIKLAQHVRSRANDVREQSALADCMELMSSSIDRVLDSKSALRSLSLIDAQTWLSTVLTNHVTCLDGLDRGKSRSAVEAEVEDLIDRDRTALSMLTSSSFFKDGNEAFAATKDEFPSWVTARDRRLMESKLNAVQANVVVAQDGSGKYKTVGEAIASAPDNGKDRYVIYVKKGTYKEKVDVGNKKKNVMIVGDGMDSTIITGSLNVVDGATTFNSATLAAVGDGFILQDIWIQNTAGPEKHQAVALRVGADLSVINRCKIDAYQDTLYAHSNRQFYRDSLITGTVDYIFGNAAVVLQNCKLVIRKPMKGQKNMVTAQGRIDPNQNTGTSIQKCDIYASTDLFPVQAQFPSYLGRPWKEYSRTVVMQSKIGDVIVPAGWFPWDGDLYLKTLYYGEYMNFGPGAGTGNRVKWPGYHVITSAQEAMKFTVAQLIQGGQWLRSTGVAFTEGL